MESGWGPVNRFENLKLSIGQQKVSVEGVKVDRR